MRDSIQETRADLLGTRGTTLLGLYFVLLPVALCALAIIVWPAAGTEAPDGADSVRSLASQYLGRSLSFDLTLLVIVLITGSLGSYIHSATSFADYVGNRRLAPSWVWWYVLRTFIGLSLAVVFYFVIRGGLLSAGASANSLNPFGVAAVSGLVGMFSKQGTDKLREVFDTLFRTNKPVERADKLDNPVPEIHAISPTSARVNEPINLSVVGNNFVPGAFVTIGGAEEQALFLGPTELRARIPGGNLSTAGPVQVTVVNPQPGGGTSAPVVLMVESQ